MVYDATIPWDMRYFESLNRIVQAEPWLTRDKAMIDQLKSIGIEKGKPFNPDAKTQDALKAAVGEAHAWLANEYENSYFPPAYYEGSHFYVPVSHDVIEGLATFFNVPNTYPVDDRGVDCTMGFFSAKHLGAGQFYLIAFKDKDSYNLEGSGSYHLNVSANAPVTQYWSATVYDRDTHALVRNMQWPSRSSQTPGLQKNADGSVDLYFGLKPPASKESTGFPPARAENLKFFSACTGHRRRYSTERGSCRTSKRLSKCGKRSVGHETLAWLIAITFVTITTTAQEGKPVPVTADILRGLRPTKLSQAL